MCRRIVIVTAVHAPSARYLPEAYESLRAQELPAGWEWHWVIQEDGTTNEVAPYVPDADRVTFRQGRPGGPGVARTIALAHAEGEYVKVLDADDRLAPGALARDLAALERDPGLGWATSSVLDLMPDGSTVGFSCDPAEGPIERGAVLDHWKTNDFRAQVHPASLFVRRDLLTALGGWMALPASEDTGVLLAAQLGEPRLVLGAGRAAPPEVGRSGDGPGRACRPRRTGGAHGGRGGEGQGAGVVPLELPDPVTPTGDRPPADSRRTVARGHPRAARGLPDYPRSMACDGQRSAVSRTSGSSPVSSRPGMTAPKPSAVVKTEGTRKAHSPEP